MSRPEIPLGQMLEAGLLTPPEFLELRAWLRAWHLGKISSQQTEEMPPHLKEALTHATILMEFNPQEWGLYPN